jgi:hypothetical protein
MFRKEVDKIVSLIFFNYKKCFMFLWSTDSMGIGGTHSMVEGGAIEEGTTHSVTLGSEVRDYHRG